MDFGPFSWVAEYGSILSLFLCVFDSRTRGLVSEIHGRERIQTRLHERSVWASSSKLSPRKRKKEPIYHPKKYQEPTRPNINDAEWWWMMLQCDTWWYIMILYCTLYEYIADPNNKYVYTYCIMTAAGTLITGIFRNYNSVANRNCSGCVLPSRFPLIPSLVFLVLVVNPARSQTPYLATKILKRGKCSIICQVTQNSLSHIQDNVHQVALKKDLKLWDQLQCKQHAHQKWAKKPTKHHQRKCFCWVSFK